MIRNEKCEVLDKQNFEPKYRRVYDTMFECFDAFSMFFLVFDDLTFSHSSKLNFYLNQYLEQFFFTFDTESPKSYKNLFIAIKKKIINV